MGTLICAKCRAIPVDGVCPLCGKNKKFIEAGDNDEVYLTSCEYIWSRMVEDALDGAGIRYRRHGTRGSVSLPASGSLRSFTGTMSCSRITGRRARLFRTPTSGR